MTPRRTGRRPVAGGFRALLLVLCCLLLARPAAAQAVRATVLDVATGAPVPEVLVRVQAQDGRLVGAAFTGADGTAVVRLREGGSYRVATEGGGYFPGAQALAVAADGTTRVDLRIAQRPFTMDTVEVVARGRDERGRDGFDRRRRMNPGVFLDSAYLSQQEAAEAMQFMAGVPGVRMWPTRDGPRPRSTRGWRCMVLLVDGYPPPRGREREFHRMVYARDVVAMEVYREFSEVPPEFRIYARQRGVPCGVYLFWTRVRW